MIKCLFVKAPFAGWIVDGVKRIDYRTRETYIRGRIGIIESGTGTVIGDAMMYECVYYSDSNLYGWLLCDARRYKTPIPFDHKQGAVVWIDLDFNPESQIISRKLSEKQFVIEIRKYHGAMNQWFVRRGIGV